MDLNGDGNADLTSGDYCSNHGRDKTKYEPMMIYCDIHIFYGTSDGTFKEKEVLLNVNGESIGKSLFRLPEYNKENVPKASDPHFVDWDKDGDLDLLIGTFEGDIIYVENLGNAKSHAFTDKLKKIEVGRKVFKADKETSPFVADFDNDGKRDLLVSDFAGDIYFIKNVGLDKKPEFFSAEKLFEGPGYFPHPMRVFDRTVKTPQAPARGARIYVCDYNGDGKMDILHGDYGNQRVYKEGLTEAEIVKLDEAIAAYNKFDAKCRSVLGKHWMQKVSELPEDERKSLSRRHSSLLMEIGKYHEYRQYGFIWLHLGK